MSRDVNAELPIFTYLPNESVASTECRSFGNTTMDEIQTLKNFLNYWEKIFFLMEGKTGYISFNFQPFILYSTSGKRKLNEPAEVEQCHRTETKFSTVHDDAESESSDNSENNSADSSEDEYDAVSEDENADENAVVSHSLPTGSGDTTDDAEADVRDHNMTIDFSLSVGADGELFLKKLKVLIFLSNVENIVYITKIVLL
jgi:hypothetical protein